MLPAPIPANEKERLKALMEYKILDTLPEKDFDEITVIASQLCQAPVAMVTLMDSERQWIKSYHGFEVHEMPRAVSFCGHTIASSDDIFIVTDAKNDARFHDNLLVAMQPHVAFYAGVSLMSANGLAIGTICVFDAQPRGLNEEQVRALKALANQVMAQIELRRKVMLLQKAEADMKEAHRLVLDEKQQRIKRFSFTTSHELRHEFSKILSLLQTGKTKSLSTQDYQLYFQELETTAASTNGVIQKLNYDLNGAHATNYCVAGKPLSATVEICLIDDNPVVNLLNELTLKDALPETSVKTFETVDDGLAYIQSTPDTERFIFLDINFDGKNAWDFLEIYKTMSNKSPVVILSSSIDPEDFQKSQTYMEVMGFYTKPLTIDTIEKLN